MVKTLKKSYETPNKGWDSERIDREENYLMEYGLTEKRELWKAESTVRNFRREARKLNATKDEQREKSLLNKLARLGVISEDSDLTDILNIEIEDILERRLQTIVFRKGLASTMKQARQFINHGHIKVNENTVDVPGYLVTKEEENNLSVSPEAKKIIQNQ